MSLSSEKIAKVAIPTGIIMGLLFFSWWFIEQEKTSHLDSERNRSLLKMKAIAVVARKFHNSHGDFPTTINIRDLKEYVKSEGLNYMGNDLEVEPEKWLEYGNDSEDRLAVERSRKVQAGHIYYCVISRNARAQGFVLMGKDSQNKFLRVTGHDPLILRESNFPRSATD